MTLSDDDVRRYIKRMRREFENSEPQRNFRELDKHIHGFNNCEIRQRQDARFNNMVKNTYGRRRTLLSFIKNGTMIYR